MPGRRPSGRWRSGCSASSRSATGSPKLEESSRCRRLATLSVFVTPAWVSLCLVSTSVSQLRTMRRSCAFGAQRWLRLFASHLRGPGSLIATTGSRAVTRHRSMTTVSCRSSGGPTRSSSVVGVASAPSRSKQRSSNIRSSSEPPSSVSATRVWVPTTSLLRCRPRSRSILGRSCPGASTTWSRPRPRSDSSHSISTTSSLQRGSCLGSGYVEPSSLRRRTSRRTRRAPTPRSPRHRVERYRLSPRRTSCGWRLGFRRG